MNDPIENIVANALYINGIEFQTENDNPAGLDFYLPGRDVYIECKQFHSERSGEQLSRAPNVILVQGLQAALFLARQIAKAPNQTSQPAHP